MEKNKKQVAKIAIFITSIFIIFLSISYAFINLTLEGTKRQVIEAGILSLVLDEDENNLTIENALPMYDEVGMLQEAFTFRLINNGTTGANYKLRLTEIGTGTLNKEDVKYGLIKDGVNKIGLLSDLPSDGTIDSGTIGASPETIEYELRFWIKDTVTDNSTISGKSLSYRVDVEVGQIIDKEPLLPVSEQLFIANSLGDNCTTYDDGVDTFLVGQCENNYVWYSGKLWRAVLKNNETGAVKLVTDNAITAIPYNQDGNTVFENSYADQWLSQEFLPTLHDTSTYLVENSVWDATLDNTEEPTRPNKTTVITRTVGLLNAYEHYTVYAQSGGLSAASTSYLSNAGSWLLTPYSATHVWYMGGDGQGSGDPDVGSFGNSVPSVGHSLYPSVNLKSAIEIDSGTGVLTDPYILKGDTKQITPGTTLLSTRYSGEYVTFNNHLYRIVNVENGLTKIVATNLENINGSHLGMQYSVPVNNGTATANFGNASIKTDLENYYQGLDSTWKNMIEANTTWYLGAVGHSNSDLETTGHYKASICATVDAATSTSNCTKTNATTTASIALPRVGEMFTSKIEREQQDFFSEFWTLTPCAGTENIRSVLRGKLICGTVSLYNKRPLWDLGSRNAMYLKQNVVIANNNTGNGTYEYPYSIQLGA